MSNYPLFSHTAIITGATGCGKTHYVLELLTNGAYKNQFDVVIVLCPTFLDNKTWLSKWDETFGKVHKCGIIKPHNGPKVCNPHRTSFFYFHFPQTGFYDINPKKYNKKSVNLQDAIEEFSNMFHGEKILFIIDDMAADEQIVKKRSNLSKLAISGRHTDRSMWLLTQKYNAICKDVREQCMWICSFWCKDKKAFEDMISENDVGLNVNNKEQMQKVKSHLQTNRYSGLFLKCHQPVGWGFISH